MRKINLFRDQGGASIVEMGLAAPILCTFLVGMIDLSGAYSAKLQVEQGAQRAIEYVQRNGYAVGQEATVKAQAVSGAGAGASATMDTWSECNGTSGTFSATCASPPISRYIRVNVSKTYTPYLKIPQAFGGGANYTVHGSAALRMQ